MNSLVYIYPVICKLTLYIIVSLYTHRCNTLLPYIGNTNTGFSVYSLYRDII